MEVRCEVYKEGVILEKEKDTVNDMYQQLFTDIYGEDVFDAFVKTVKKAVPNIKSKLAKLYYLSENYQRSQKALAMIEGNDTLELLKVYDSDDNIIGVGRLRKISDTVASVPDLAFIDSETKKEVINQVLEFIENYFISLGYERIELEIPFKDVIYLARANKLGYLEDIEDMNTGLRTYLLNKSLERKITNETARDHR